jgi:hypothetical protein
LGRVRGRRDAMAYRSRYCVNPDFFTAGSQSAR